MDEDTTAAVVEIGEQLRRLADRILPYAAVPVTDAAGVGVGSLTEAVMGLTAATVQVAGGLHAIAEAIRERN